MLIAVPITRTLISSLADSRRSYFYDERGSWEIGILDTDDGIVEKTTISEIGRLIIDGVDIKNLDANAQGVYICALHDSFVCGGDKKIVFDYSMDNYTNYIQYGNFNIEIRTFDSINMFTVIGNRFYLFHTDNTLNNTPIICTYINLDGEYRVSNNDTVLEVRKIDYRTYLRGRLVG